MSYNTTVEGNNLVVTLENRTYAVMMQGVGQQGAAGPAGPGGTVSDLPDNQLTRDDDGHLYVAPPQWQTVQW